MSEYSGTQSDEIPFVSLSEIAERSVEQELQEKLKPATFGGYSKGSVAQYARELKNSLEQMRVNLEQQIKDLAAEKGNLSQECSLLRSQLSEAEKRVARLQKESEDRERKVAQIMEEMNLKIRNMDHDNETLRLENSKIEEAKAELEHLRRQLQTKEDEAGSLAAQLEKSRSLCEGLKSRIKELEDIQRLSPDNAEELKQLRQEKKSFSGKLKEADQRGKELREQWEKETGELSERLSTAEERNRQLETSFEELKKDRSEQCSRFEQEYLEKLNIAYRSLREVKEEKNSLLDRIAAQGKVGADLTEKFNVLRNRLISLQNSSDSLEKEKTVLGEQVAQYRRKEQERELYQKQNERLSGEIASMKAGVKDILSQMELQKNMVLDIITRSTESFTELQEKMHSLLQEKTELQGRNGNLMEEIDRLTAGLSAAEQDLMQPGEKPCSKETADFAKKTVSSDALSLADGLDESGKMFAFDREGPSGCSSIDAALNQALDITQWLEKNSDEIKTRYAAVAQKKEG